MKGTKMKAIVIGLGSMGRRRIRLLQSYDRDIFIIGVDTRKERREQANQELGIATSESIEKACQSMEVNIAFISTSPLSHASIIKECLERSMHVFTEINLVDTRYEENMRLAKEKGLTLFLSSTFLYRNEIQYIKEKVKSCKLPLSYVYHAGQYLPDWHPWESYKNFFVGNKETNGCREFMAIEFPWIFDVFGNIKKVYSVSGKASSLDINFPDNYQIIFEHESGHKGVISIDIVSRKAVRNFELSGEEVYLTWDGTPNRLHWYNHEKKIEESIQLYETVNKRNDYSASIIENAYYNEICNYLDVIKGNDVARYSFEKDKYVLSIIDEIEGRK